MIIEIENLKKSFKDVAAVDGVSFKVKEGELFAFLGVNGAGKSTTINIISGILKKDEGKVRVCGYDLDEGAEKAKERTGIVFQNSVLDRKLSVYDNIKSRAALYGFTGEKFKQRLEEISGLFELDSILKKPVFKLSGGQKRRVDIARALFHKPELLILDEPTTGLDPKTRITVWSVIDKLRKQDGLTVLLTTHYMEEAANADYVVIIDGGRIVGEGTPHDMKVRYASDFIRFYDRQEQAKTYFEALGFKTRQNKQYLEVEMKGTREIARHIAENPEIFGDFEVLKGDMDSVFLTITGKELKEV